MISDFIDENDFRNALTIANRKHDIVAIQYTTAAWQSYLMWD